MLQICVLNYITECVRECSAARNSVSGLHVRCNQVEVLFAASWAPLWNGHFALVSFQVGFDGVTSREVLTDLGKVSSSFVFI